MCTAAWAPDPLNYSLQKVLFMRSYKLQFKRFQMGLDHRLLTDYCHRVCNFHFIGAKGCLDKIDDDYRTYPYCGRKTAHRLVLIQDCWMIIKQFFLFLKITIECPFKSPALYLTEYNYRNTVIYIYNRINI